MLGLREGAETSGGGESKIIFLVLFDFYGKLSKQSFTHTCADSCAGTDKVVQAPTK